MARHAPCLRPLHLLSFAILVGAAPGWLISHGDLHAAELIQRFKLDRIGAERNESPLVGNSFLVGFLDPLDRRLDSRRRNTLRDVEQIDKGKRFSCLMNERLQL